MIKLLFLVSLFLIPSSGDSSDIESMPPDSLAAISLWTNAGIPTDQVAPEGSSSLDIFQVVPESAVVYVKSIYHLHLNIPRGGIPRSGGISIAFPDGFDLRHVDSVEYADDYEGEDLDIRYVHVSENEVTVFFKRAKSPPSGTVITLSFHDVKNPRLAGVYHLAGIIFNRWLRTVAGPDLSEPFEILPSVPVSLTLTPDYPLELKAGQTQVFKAVAMDVYDNEVPAGQFRWTVSPSYDNIGVVSGGIFLATSVGTGKILVTCGDLTAFSDWITVIAGAIDHFDFMDYPPIVTAGESFPAAVSVAARDAFGNLKRDFNGSVYFKSTDSLARFFYDYHNRYDFVGSDSGIHAFDGSLFSLVTAGRQKLFVTDGDHIGSTGLITVEGGAVPGFAIEYVANSLTIDTVLSPSEIAELSVAFTASGDRPLVSPNLYIDIQVEITPGNWDTIHSGRCFQTYQEGLFSLTYLRTFVPDYSLVSGVTEGYKTLRVAGFIIDLGRVITLEPLEAFDSIYVAFPAVLSYVASSLAPTAVPAGSAHVLECDILMDGSTSIVLDRSRSRFELAFDGDLLAAFLSQPEVLRPGKNHVVTGAIFFPDSLVNRVLTPRLIISGVELYVPRHELVNFGEESILVSEQTSEAAQLRILSTDLVTLNPPFVNYGQSFKVAVAVENISAVDADSVSLYIQTEDGQAVVSELHGLTVPAFTVLDTSLVMTAPEHSLPAVIYRVAIAAPDDVSILSPVDNLFAIDVQSPAMIELFCRPIGTSEGLVDYNQSFSIEVRMENLGEAEALPGQVSLMTGGYDFGIPDSSAQTIAVDSTGYFFLTAPSDQITTSLTVKITDVPIDRNTGRKALVKAGTVAIPITVISNFAELVVDGFAADEPLIVEGDVRDLFHLELKNSTEDISNVIALKSMVIEVTDRYGTIIPPDRILIPRESGFYSGDTMISQGQVSNGRLRMVFYDYLIEANEVKSIVFRARFNDVLSAGSFNIGIDSRDISAIFAAGPRINQSVPVRGVFADGFRIGANYVVIEETLEGSLMVRNNPFNPDLDCAEIAYFLEEETEISMTIYTLSGEKVYEKLYPAGSQGASAGQNHISWSGRNDEGRTVLNGVYVAVIKPGNTGRTYKLKLAVMK
jgi:hypothetical protein